MMRWLGTLATLVSFCFILTLRYHDIDHELRIVLAAGLFLAIIGHFAWGFAKLAFFVWSAAIAWHLRDQLKKR